MVGWRGSRPTSPVAAGRSDGVTVVPATGTLPRQDAVATGSSPVSFPASPAPAAIEPRSDEVEDIDAIAADFGAQPRDPSWAPGAEAGLRAAVGYLPGLAAAPAIACRTSLCRLTATVPADVKPEESDRAVAALQAATSAEMRARRPFGAKRSAVMRVEEDGTAQVTLWLVRR